MPNQSQALAHAPVWKKVARLEKQSLRQSIDGSLLLETGSFYDPKHVSLHIVEPLTNSSHNHSIVKKTKIGEESFAILPNLRTAEAPIGSSVNTVRIAGRPPASKGPVSQTTIIGWQQFAILPDTRTCEVLGVDSVAKVHGDHVLEACSIYRDDVVILLTRTSKHLLVSVDGFYYRAYAPLELGKLRCKLNLVL